MPCDGNGLGVLTLTLCRVARARVRDARITTRTAIPIPHTLGIAPVQRPAEAGWQDRRSCAAAGRALDGRWRPTMRTRMHRHQNAAAALKRLWQWGQRSGMGTKMWAAATADSRGRSTR